LAAERGGGYLVAAERELAGHAPLHKAGGVHPPSSRADIATKTRDGQRNFSIGGGAGHAVTLASSGLPDTPAAAGLSAGAEARCPLYDAGSLPWLRAGIRWGREG